MRRKTALFVALVVLSIVSISYFIWFRYIRLDSHFEYGYEKTIVRNTSNTEEANALTIVENSNYSDIFDLRRFETWDHNETWPYTWAEFIDTEVIEYYDYRFESLKEKLGEKKPEGIRFHYEASVFTWDEIRVVYISAPEGGNIHDDSIQVLSLNGSVLFENNQYIGPTWGMKFAYRNDSEYREITAEEINFSLARSYVVEMTLRYSETYGPLAAFTSMNYQIIVVDQDLVPVLFCTQSKKRIS